MLYLGVCTDGTPDTLYSFGNQQALHVCHVCALAMLALAMQPQGDQLAIAVILLRC